ncbi:MAG TPA: hypothetical protein VF017_19130 [Thermoanaerobaculia bacterium]|nr:hypothetical protein [Thermoanaerobaculia bacterium]
MKKCHALALGVLYAFVFSLTLLPAPVTTADPGPTTPVLASEPTLAELEAGLFNPRMQPKLGCRVVCPCTSGTYSLPAPGCWGCGSDCTSAVSNGQANCRAYADDFCYGEGWDHHCQISYTETAPCTGPPPGAVGGGMCTSSQVGWDGTATFRCRLCTEICP